MASFGFAFRATSGFVTDGAGDTYVLQFADEPYPVTRNGITFGVESHSADNSRDRDNTVNPRLAGDHFDVGGGSIFRVDLPSTGAWTIRAAHGGVGQSGTYYAQYQDTTTPFATTAAMVCSTTQFGDATGVVRTSVADWVTNNASISHTFTTTIFRMAFGDATTEGHPSYLFIDSGAVASGPAGIAGPRVGAPFGWVGLIRA